VEEEEGTTVAEDAAMQVADAVEDVARTTLEPVRPRKECAKHLD
jgi:hypothetical protein